METFPKEAILTSSRQQVSIHSHTVTHTPVRNPPLPPPPPSAALAEDDVLAFPKTLQTARAVMLFNLASVFCLRRETDKARKALQQAASLFTGRPPRQVILLSAYIELVSGESQTDCQC